MTLESIQELRRLAEAAKEIDGAWFTEDNLRGDMMPEDAAFSAAYSPKTILNLLDEIELANRKLEKARAALEFYADDSIQTREVVTQYKDSPPWTGFVKETGDDRRKSDKGRIARAALAELEGK